MCLRITGGFPPLRLSTEVAAVRPFVGESFGRQLLKLFDAEILVMDVTVPKKRELSKRRKKPSTYRRIATGNVDEKAVVRSDVPLRAYEFKTIPGCQHTLIWVNATTPDLSREQRLTVIPTPSFQDPGAPACTS